jgi:hypothetical protein
LTWVPRPRFDGYRVLPRVAELPSELQRNRREETSQWGFGITIVRGDGRWARSRIQVAAAGDGSRSGITCVEGGRGTEGKGMLTMLAIWEMYWAWPIFPRAARSRDEDDENLERIVWMAE